MRYWVPVLVASLALAGCLDDDGGLSGDEPAVGDEGHPSFEVVEVYKGDLVTVQAGGQIAYSHDQLGDNHREFWVVDGTGEIRLDLNVTAADLQMRAVGPGCSQDKLQTHGFMAPPDCTHTASTENGQGDLVIEDPEAGPWMVYFFMSSHEGEAVPGGLGEIPVRAEEVPYRLTLTKLQPPHEALQEERYPGEVVAAHLGAIRISPDQLGDVYREFWVHEGTKRLELEFEAEEDVYVVVGQSFRGRNAYSEQGWETEQGKLSLEFNEGQIHHGGWYLIVFHETTQLPVPDVSQVPYHLTVTKHREALSVTGTMDAEEKNA